MAYCDRLQRELYVLEQQLDDRRRNLNGNQLNNLIRGITIKRDEVARACNQNFNEDNDLGEELEFGFVSKKRKASPKRKAPKTRRN